MNRQPSKRRIRSYRFRGQSVCFDFDIAAAFGLTTQHLNQIAKRNPSRFPATVIFQLTEDEFRRWRAHTHSGAIHLRNCRYRPYVYTLPGYSMLLSRLNSDFAINEFINQLTYLWESRRSC